MSLYQKHRPNTFKDVIGLGSAKAILDQIHYQDCNRFLIFAGPSGTGKTALARITAFEVGATNLSCKEINGADQNGVDVIRQISKDSEKPSIDGAPIVWVIDEAHKLTNQAQSALLKPLEDIPHNVWFMLCTTEPHRLVKAIRSRALFIQTKLLTKKELTRLLRKVANREGIETKEDLPAMVEAAHGSAREALNILEKYKSSGVVDGTITDEDHEDVRKLCGYLLDHEKWSIVGLLLKQLETIYEPETIRRAVANYMKFILLKGEDNHRAAYILEMFMDPVYETGWYSVIVYCYAVLKGE